MLPPYALIFLLVCFYGNWFCSPTINQISLGQSKGWFPFISKHFLPIRKLIWFHKNQKSVRIKNYLSPIYTDHYALKNKKCYHSVFNFQHSSHKLLQQSIINLLYLYLEFQVSLIDLLQSDIQIFYSFEIVNGIQQCVNSSWTGILRTNLWSMVSMLNLLQCLSFQFIKNGSATM